MFLISGSPDVCRWRNKHPENWNSKDVLDWLFYTAEKCNLEFSKLHSENFQSISGSDLCKLSIEDFERIESVYGRMLYSLFKDLRDGCKYDLLKSYYLLVSYCNSISPFLPFLFFLIIYQ